MKVLIDTNILISAALSNKGTPYQAFVKAAIYARADILLTGDKDFLESGLHSPKIMTAADFITMK